MAAGKLGNGGPVRTLVRTPIMSILCAICTQSEKSENHLEIAAGTTADEDFRLSQRIDWL